MIPVRLYVVPVAAGLKLSVMDFNVMSHLLATLVDPILKIEASINHLAS